jgi:hypothetical protein
LAARSILCKTISMLVIIVMIMANFNVVQAQDSGTETPTATPPAEVTDTPGPAAPVETVEIPTATEIPPVPSQAAAPTPQGTPPEPTAALPAGFSISGTVTDQAGQGLIGVRVSDDKGHYVQTDESGLYSLDGLAPGNYQVRAALPNIELIPFFRMVHVLDKNVSGVNFYPRQEPQPGYINVQPMSVTHAPVVTNLPIPTGEEIESQAVTKPGTPGTAYALDTTWHVGTTGVPYTVEAAGAIGFLNAPSALALDGSGHVWEAEEHGNRLEAINYTSLSPYMKIGDKPGVSTMDHYVYNSLMAVGHQPASNFLWVGDTTRLVKYDTSLVYPDTYRLQFPATNPWQSGSDKGHFSEIRGIAFNDAGTVMYVSDRFNHRIQIFDVSGTDPLLTGTLGQPGASGRDDFHFNQPWHITYYGSYLYVADSQNHRIQQCPTTGGACTTVAGVGAAGFELNQLNTPTAVAITSTVMYITDAYNQRVLRCNFDGIAPASDCHVFAGVTGEAGSDLPYLRWPADVVVQGSQVFVADRDNHRILELNDPGTSDPGSLSHQFGMTGQAYIRDVPLDYPTHVYRPWGIAIDTSDNDLYVAEDWGYSLAKFNSTGRLIWRVPADPGNYGSDLHHFGSFPGSNQGQLAVDAKQRVYVPDLGNNRVMIYLPDGTLFDQLGTGLGSGPYQFSCPSGVGLSNTYIYVADACNQRIQIFDYNLHYVGTLGQTGLAGTDSSHFSNPVSVGVDQVTGKIYVVDQGNQRVQRCQFDSVHKSFTCGPFAGVTGVSGGRDSHYLNHPINVLVDSTNGRVLVSEEDTSRVQVFGMDGSYLTTISGEWGDEGGRVRSPSGLAIDSLQSVYVADRENSRILRFLSGVTDWKQVNINGFGDPRNINVTGLTFVKIMYKTALTRMLYAAVINESQGPALSQVWRQLPDDTWQAVSAPGFGDPANFALTDMVYYDDSLFVGTHNPHGGQIWRCKNLSNNPCEKTADWTPLPMPVGFSTANQIVSRMVVFNGQMFVSTINWTGNWPYSTTGAEVWIYDGSDWTSSTEPSLKLNTTMTETPVAISGIHAMAASSDSSMLYAGTTDYISASPTPAQLYRYAYNSVLGNYEWHRLKQNGIDDIHNTAINSLVAKNGYLYVGTSNATEGGRIYRYVDTDLSAESLVMSGPMGSDQNISIDAMIANDDHIYAMATNYHIGFAIFIADTGGGIDNVFVYTPFKLGLGNATNTYVYSDSSLSFTPAGNLMVGTCNEDNGSALWLYTPSSAYSEHIGGHINYTGPALTDINVILQPGGTIIHPLPSGDYVFNSLLPGAYTVTAQYNFLSFTPPVQPVTITIASRDDVDFDVASGGIDLSQPANGTQLTSLNPVTLTWIPYRGATSYRLQISNFPGFSPLLKNITQAGTSFKLAGLAGKKTYYWRVQKANSPTGSWSAPFSFSTPNPTPPAAPVLLTPTNGLALAAGVLRPTLTWKPSLVPTGGAPVQHYHIQLSRVNTFVSLDVDEYTPNASTAFIPTAKLTPNQVYYWRVRAFNTHGAVSVWPTSPFSFKVKPLPPQPAVLYDENTLQPGIHWKDPYCTGKYLVEIYKASTPTHPFISQPVTTGASCEGDYHLTTSLLVNTAYGWRVTTQGATGSSIPFTSTFNTPISVPGTPTLTGPANNATIPDGTYLTWQPRLTWNPVSAAPAIVQNYEVQLATQPGFGAYTYLTAPVAAAFTFYTPDTLKYNTSVYWRVRACDNHKNCSGWSAPRKIVTRPAKPTAISVYDSLQVVFKWVDPGNNFATKYYVIIYSNPPTCSTRFIDGTVTTTSFTALLSPGKKYCWKVRGLASSNTVAGAYSDIADLGPITVLPAPLLSTPPNAALISSKGLIDPGYHDYKISFGWSAAPGAFYHLQVSKTPDFTSLVVDDKSLTEPNYTGRFSAGKYYWRVRAGNGSLWSQWSAVRNLTTRGQLSGRTYAGTTWLPDVQVNISGVTTPFHTDSSGLLQIDDLPTGTHTLTFSKTGYITQTRSLTFANGASTPADVAMISTAPVGVLRVVLTWNPQGGRKLVENLWLPPGAKAMHIFKSNTGKANLDLFPNAMGNPSALGYGQSYVDIKPFTGNYVFGVYQDLPATTSWSGSEAKVEIFDGPTMKKTCSLPGGSGRWWYAFDLKVSGGGSYTVTCKNSLRPTSPGPYADHPIYGSVRVEGSNHPLSGAVVNYDYGQVKSDDFGNFTIVGVIRGAVTLTGQIFPANYTFSPPLSAPVDSFANNLTAYPIADLISIQDPRAVAMRGDYAYVGVGSWLYVVNAADKADPVLVSRLWLGGSPSSEVISRIGLFGKLAVLSIGSRLDIVNLNDLLHPYFQGMISLSPYSASSFVVSDNHIYVTSNGTFYIYNLDGSLSFSKKVGSSASAEDMVMQGKYVYIIGTNGLYIFDVSNPSAPGGPFTFSFAHGGDKIAVDGAYVYSYGVGKVYVLNVSDPRHIQQVSALDYAAAPFKLVKSGKFLYLALGNFSPTDPYGLTIIDASDPYHLALRGNYHDAVNQFHGTDVVVQENYAYLAQAGMYASSGGSLSVIDLSNKDAPGEVGSYTPGP